MTDNKKWKSKLLSASFPLEFQTAKILADKGFYIRGDYTYSRNDSGIDKDFSVDILATGYSPFTNPNKTSICLDLLVECKYRDRNTTWLFLPSICEELIVAGYFLRQFDNFSTFKITKAPKSYKFSIEECQYAYKAIEIKMTTEPSVYDSEIKHGLSQLQYALPRLISQSILMNGLYPSKDNHPFVICPILVTTAKLLLTNKAFGINKVEEASKLDDLGEEVPYVIIEHDYGPDFERHCVDIFKSFADLENHEGVQGLELIRRNSKLTEYDFYYPSKIVQGLASGEQYLLSKYFSQFIICNFEALPSLIDIIKSIVSNMARYKKSY